MGCWLDGRLGCRVAFWGGGKGAVTGLGWQKFCFDGFYAPILCIAQLEPGSALDASGLGQGTVCLGHP